MSAWTTSETTWRAANLAHHSRADMATRSGVIFRGSELRIRPNDTRSIGENMSVRTSEAGEVGRVNRCPPRSAHAPVMGAGEPETFTPRALSTAHPGPRS